MKGVCGLVIDKDKVFLGFASLEKNRVVFLEEAEFEMPWGEENFVAHLRAHAESLNQRIKEKEKELALEVEKIYCVLPADQENRCIAEDTIVLSKRKKITTGDIAYAKKYLEDIYLNLDDFCIHHFVSHYDVDGAVYKHAPLKTVAKKIKIKSFLSWIKERDFKDIKEIFDNLEREFAGFVSARVAVLPAYTSKAELSKPLLVCAMGFETTWAILYQDGVLMSEKEFPFGARQLFDEIGKQCGLSTRGLAEEVFNRYVSFQEGLLAKEVSIKDGSSYINLSTNALNMFVKNFFSREFTGFIDGLKSSLPADTTIAFWGRMCAKEGFHAFMQKNTNFPVKCPATRGDTACSCGAMNYGVHRFLERDATRQETLIGRVLSIYKEYF